MKTKDEKEKTFIRHIKEGVAINLQELGWCQGHHEMDGKYCLVGMLRGVVLDAISEWYAEMERRRNDQGRIQFIQKNIGRYMPLSKIADKIYFSRKHALRPL